MSTTQQPAARSGFGPLLREWRRARRKSQLALALDANVSSRHLGFIEIGRSYPSREMVLTLANALEVPMRERNDLLSAAGFAPIYRDIGWDESQLTHIRNALRRILTKQEPYPAVVMDRYWNISMMNDAARRFFALFLPAAPAGSPNVLRAMFDPSLLRPYVSNWDEVAQGLIQRMHREAVGGMDADPKTRELLAELLAYPGIPTRWATPDLDSVPIPVIPVSFQKDELRLSFFSTVTTLGTPQDIRLQETRIESFHPADEATERLAEQLLSSDADRAP